VTIAVSLADKLDTLAGFFVEGMPPSGSRDPFALRRAALGIIATLVENGIRLPLNLATFIASSHVAFQKQRSPLDRIWPTIDEISRLKTTVPWRDVFDPLIAAATIQANEDAATFSQRSKAASLELLDFFADRLKVQQREAGVRHDLIDAIFALGGEDDLVRLLARVNALQAFVATEDGGNLLAGYKRAANILRIEEKKDGAAAAATAALGPDPLAEEQALSDALDKAEPAATTAIAAEDFAGAMRALAALRAPVDAFFDKVTVNDADPAKRAARLSLLARVRDAVHRVADFSRIEG